MSWHRLRKHDHQFSSISLVTLTKTGLFLQVGYITRSGESEAACKTQFLLFAVSTTFGGQTGITGAIGEFAAGFVRRISGDAVEHEEIDQCKEEIKFHHLESADDMFNRKSLFMSSFDN